MPAATPPAVERRSLYRILHVQPEAPHEVIKAAYRALMLTLRAHPDLGGDDAQAARLNAAWAVLGDPERRREYDRALAPPRRASASRPAAATSSPARATAARTRDPWSWAADRVCPFCSRPFTGSPALHQRCTRCEAPLWPAPSPSPAAREASAAGRRQAPRFERHQRATLLVPGQPLPHEVRLRDLSMNGVSLHHAAPLPPASVVRIVGAGFDAVAVVIACRRQGAVHCLHARLLTLELLKQARGVFVDARA